MILQTMRQRRIERGALTLASAEVKFQIDTETHDPLDIGMLSKQQVICSLNWNGINTVNSKSSNGSSLLLRIYATFLLI